MSVLDHQWIIAFDATVDRWADRLRGRPLLDRGFYALTAAGDHGMAWHVVGALRAVTGRDSWRSGVELSAGLGVEAALVNGPMKWCFRRIRPEAATPRPHRLRTPSTSSFPSGHASAGMFAAVLLARTSRHRWVWFVLGGLIGWSRVHVQIHHPSDVIGGAVVGLALGAAGCRVLDSPKGRALGSVRSTP